MNMALELIIMRNKYYIILRSADAIINFFFYFYLSFFLFINFSNLLKKKIINKSFVFLIIML